jgi:integrase
VPIHTFVLNILERYGYNLPKVINNQKFNEYIKEICKQASIEETIIIHETKGNLKYSKTEPKYSLVSTHTARRSFATNAFIAGIPTVQIMKITGHKSERVFMKYIKITAKENAARLKLHPFFNKAVKNSI